MKKSALLCACVLVAAAALGVANEALKPAPVQQLELNPREIQSEDTRSAPPASESQPQTSTVQPTTGG